MSDFDRPAFLARFPEDDPELSRLVRAFVAGDYATVRRAAPALAERTEREDVRAAAEELRRRIDPDPLMLLVVGLSAGLLLVVVLWQYLGHGHG